uniref:Uncharacterized protein n=1 Tax=Rhizophora mucronata TaxID=61149 RepID=A0A2P2IZS5_RHIMU
MYVLCILFIFVDIWPMPPVI